MNGKDLALALVALGGLVVLYFVAFKGRSNPFTVPPVSPYTTDPTAANSTENTCRQILVAGGGIAAATGNPYAVVAGLGVAGFNKQLCDKTSGWGALNPIPGGADTIDKWKNGDKKGAVLDVLNPLTPFKQLKKFW